MRKILLLLAFVMTMTMISCVLEETYVETTPYRYQYYWLTPNHYAPYYAPNWRHPKPPRAPQYVSPRPQQQPPRPNHNRGNQPPKPNVTPRPSTPNLQGPSAPSRGQRPSGNRP